MRTLKIVADSSADILTLEGMDFTCAPLKVITDEKEFIDDEKLNLDEMIEYLSSYNGKSKSSCPNTADWLSAFGDAEDIFCITITSGLSGSYNSACSAKQIYENEHEGRRVFVIDSLSAGPELRLIIEKLQDYIREGLAFEEICTKIKEYQNHTGLLFMLKSLKNFANNGRVSPILAKVVGVMGIGIVGKASDEGTLEPTDKCRGESRALIRIAELLKGHGLSSGRVRIAHCQNEAGAKRLKEIIEGKCCQANIKIFELRGLCSFYAEKGGILVGYEKM